MWGVNAEGTMKKKLATLLFFACGRAFSYMLAGEEPLSTQKDICYEKFLKECKVQKRELNSLINDVKNDLQSTLQQEMFKFQKGSLNAIKKEVLKLEGFLRESWFANVFNSSTSSCEWLKGTDFCPSGFAANFSYLYVLFRFLNDFNPTSILEFGPGQTSRMLSRYVDLKNKNAAVYVVEHNPAWIDFIQKNKLVSDSIKILLMPLKEVGCEGYTTKVYEGLRDHLKGMKFDLVMVDGGDTSTRYSRTSVLELIPENLHPSFVIIIDDFNRPGEKDTAQLLVKKLDDYKIKYFAGVYKGLREQKVIVSEDLYFGTHM
ncbi:MAG: hypothetical protein WC365_01910 [Candidatus Babeliales bacterium]|jgi:hypothetical protein